MSEKWNSPELQKIADEPDERFRREDIRTNILKRIAELRVDRDGICKKCGGKDNDKDVQSDSHRAQFCQIFARAVYVDGQPIVIERNLARSDTLSESWQQKTRLRKLTGGRTSHSIPDNRNS